MARARGPVDQGASLVRSQPLRWQEGDSGRTAEEVRCRGWFDGAAECARIVADVMALDVKTGGGFGGSWPFLAAEKCVVAPALPVVACHEAVSGPDGEYRLGRRGVWREAGGTESLCLAIGKSGSPPGKPFDLLWFGVGERFLVRDQRLIIEDLFGQVRVAATGAVLDQLLIRPRRLDSAVVSGVPIAETHGKQTVEVRRPADLSADDGWRDAGRFLSARTDVVSAKSAQSTVEVQLHDGTTAVFLCHDAADGWTLKLLDGGYIFNEIGLERRHRTLCLRAELADGIDALATGMRGRLIFDLRADLVAMG